MGSNSKEILKVLDLVEKGAINASEAQELISSINSSVVDFNEEKEKVKDNINKFADSCNDKIDAIKMKVDPKIKKVLTGLAEKLDEMAEKLYDEEMYDDSLEIEDLEELEEALEELNSLDADFEIEIEVTEEEKE